jgi:hypothetical protein
MDQSFQQAQAEFRRLGLPLDGLSSRLLSLTPDLSSGLNTSEAIDIWGTGGASAINWCGTKS